MLARDQQEVVRTELTVVLGYLGLVLEDEPAATGGPAAVRREWLRRAYASAEAAAEAASGGEYR